VRSIAERVREVMETLTAEKQAEVLDFAEFLRARTVLPSESDTVHKARLRSERHGALRDAFTIAPDFDAPLPDDVQRDFEGG
jgi:uncharacterized protein DUF2281